MVGKTGESLEGLECDRGPRPILTAGKEDSDFILQVPSRSWALGSSPSARHLSCPLSATQMARVALTGPRPLTVHLDHFLLLEILPAGYSSEGPLWATHPRSWVICFPRRLSPSRILQAASLRASEACSWIPGGVFSTHRAIPWGARQPPTHGRRGRGCADVCRLDLQQLWAEGLRDMQKAPGVGRVCLLRFLSGVCLFLWLLFSPAQDCSVPMGNHSLGVWVSHLGFVDRGRGEERKRARWRGVSHSAL